jgi:hypothetical protein
MEFPNELFDGKFHQDEDESNRDSGSSNLDFPFELVFDLSHFQADKADDSDNCYDCDDDNDTDRDGDPVPVVVERPLRRSARIAAKKSGDPPTPIAVKAPSLRRSSRLAAKAQVSYGV